VGNYRPISLTSIVGKILESITKEVTGAHLENHNLIKLSQHGFMKGKSCLTNLLALLKEVSPEWIKGNSRCVVSGLPEGI